MTLWTVAHQAPPSMGFSRQEYWNGLPFPSPGDLPDQGIKPGSPELQTNSLPSEPPGKQHLNKFHPIKSIFVNSEPQEMWTEAGKWQLSFLSPFNSRTSAASTDNVVNKNPKYLNFILYESIKPLLLSCSGFYELK